MKLGTHMPGGERRKPIDIEVCRSKVKVTMSIHMFAIRLLHLRCVTYFLLFRIPLNGLTQTHFCACPKQRHGFPLAYAMVSCIQRFEVRGDCSFTWYRRNSWPSLLKLSIHNHVYLCKKFKYNWSTPNHNMNMILHSWNWN